ncbi:hypothetical protein [Sphingobacterium haloxyli]|uniref:Uncharacterized protein n=1 Tax=Sphingobacterium haloxyli TaxID=2100533 RepID=A0A2S9J4C1_9SPHI|nr:hypothetical protein [Sphingobacterium haloxyli]PRD47631.1 hypothetical protein C5745_10005 [Sphingobacterium haloxyli]
MKALKIKYLKGAFTVFALCLIGTVSAAPNGNGDEKEEKKNTTSDEIKKTQSSEWFVYNGPNQTRLEVEKPENYSLHDDEDNPEPTCSTGNELCAVNATDNGGQPSLPSTFVDDIMAAIQAGGQPSNSNIKLRN